MYPTWIDGEQTSEHRRDFAGRYEAIHAYLEDMGFTGMTVLDFGAGGGYFTARLAEDFDAKVTAVESDPRARDGLATSHAEKVITRHLTAQDVADLGKFDVALALSVLHHVPGATGYLDALTAVAPVVFIELANPQENLPRAKHHRDSASLVEAVEELSFMLLAETPGYDPAHDRKLYVIDQRQQGASAGVDWDRTDAPQPEGAAEDLGDDPDGDAEGYDGTEETKPKRKSRKKAADDD